MDQEKKMSELFANVKMDIMAERQNTANAERRADEAERRADEAERRADEALKNLAALEETIRKLMEKPEQNTDSKKTAPDRKD